MVNPSFPRTTFILTLSSTPSSMDNLPAELLCEIILKNAERDYHSHNRLVTALRSSQVCQIWRAIILACPSLWGRLLDLSYFEKAKESWTQEVIARGNGAALWITGHIVSSTTLPLFKSLMKDHWERVQDLEVIDYQTQGPKKMWSVLLQKAPILERLSIKYPPLSYPRRAGPVVIRSLFNVAPRLLEFRVPGNFQFNMNTPCISNIRVFTFPAEYSVPMILSSLKLLPRLTHLRIESHRFIGHPPPPKMDLVEVDLLSLESLKIVGRDYYDVQALLECITPSSRCGLLLTQGEPRLYHIRDPARHIWGISVKDL
ncbi:hypothetical protein D9613_011850 [Agrocybe pediades]|uniref:F-box domain-containing protein n=1 Tax=Agrocybe pediades TaxID=84607 RepID=A0A8H4VK56_9AGAR|nr:hypothetical protein D9613_011850 [Agrocybe pediades]